MFGRSVEDNIVEDMYYMVRRERNYRTHTRSFNYLPNPDRMFLYIVHLGGRDSNHNMNLLARMPFQEMKAIDK